eukprot:TRINITY_DN1525_c0_g1_i8.p1 TRINITY_DN1525_c0_g1~~TRINITY_DN1525_c0_g1_i8.p1  ORF type:complete len:624 (+),score=98.61 TRINITY_DN1525_c0_g1_i8:143-2014(+)
MTMPVIQASASSALLSTCSVQNRFHWQGRMKVHPSSYQRAFLAKWVAEQERLLCFRAVKGSCCSSCRLQPARSSSKLVGCVDMENESLQGGYSVDELSVYEISVIRENPNSARELVEKNVSINGNSATADNAIEDFSNTDNAASLANIESATIGEGLSVNSEFVEAVPEAQFLSDSGISEGQTLEPTLTIENPLNESGPSSAPSIGVNGSDLSFDKTRNFFEGLFSNFEESLRSSIDISKNTIKNIYDDTNASIFNSGKRLINSFENTLSGFPTVGFSSEYSIDLTSPFRMGTPANNAIKRVVIVVEDSAGSLLSRVPTTLGGAYSSAKSVLPTEYRSVFEYLEQKVTNVVEPLGSAAKQLNALITEVEKTVGVDPENPIFPVVIGFWGTLTIGFLYWQYTCGGYSGDITPKLAADLLVTDPNTVLIDIRPEELKERDGIPDIRRRARFRFATVELPMVDPEVKKSLKNAKEIDDLLLAVLIKNLQIVNSKTKVLVMDTSGSQSKRVARALRKLGIKRTFRVQGGFQSWMKDDLRVKEFYNETPFTILKEETEAILEEARPPPGAILAACIGLVAAVNALIEWEKTLQLIGFVAVVQFISKRINSYESAEDFKADIRSLMSIQ